MMDTLLAALGLSKGSVIGGFFGGAVSLKFIDGAWWQRATTAASGCVCAAYIAPLVLELVHVTLNLRNEIAVAFLIGLFGMSVVAQILRALPEWAAALKSKIFGGGS